MFSKLLLFSILGLSIIEIFGTPIPRCDDPHELNANEPCLLALFAAKSGSLQGDSWPSDVQFVQRRNSELSSALNFLYGNNKFPGKRNPDLSSALIKYINSNNGRINN